MLSLHSVFGAVHSDVIIFIFLTPFDYWVKHRTFEMQIGAKWFEHIFIIRVCFPIWKIENYNNLCCLFKIVSNDAREKWLMKTILKLTKIYKTLKAEFSWNDFSSFSASLFWLCLGRPPNRSWFQFQFYIFFSPSKDRGKNIEIQNLRRRT